MALKTDGWNLRPPFSAVSVAIAFAVMLVLAWTGVDVEVPQMLRLTANGAADAVGMVDHSQVGDGFAGLARQMFPPVIARRTPLERLPGFDRENLPPFAYIGTTESFDVHIDYDTLEQDISVKREETLVEPVGYLLYVLVKMWETLEIGIWGTVLSVLISAPLAILSARNYTPHWLVYGTARSLVSLCRAVPELVSALFFVLAYGFGPIAGVLALGFHCTGFLGKFYAEDIENADRGPQDALRALGASRLRVLRVAVLPQVLPQYVAYTLYILDRNSRMATIIGIVGAGGIGQELKGRWDIFH
jgi:phosphonate transport system permease protein